MKVMSKSIEDEMEQSMQFEKELSDVAVKYTKDGLNPFLVYLGLLHGVMHALLRAHINDQITGMKGESFESAASTFLDECVHEWCEENEDKIKEYTEMFSKS